MTRQTIQRLLRFIMSRLSHILPILALFWGSIVTHAVELIGKPVVTTTANSATLEWRTDVACGTRAQFGTDPAQLTQKAEGAVTAQHRLDLTDLAPACTYHYSVGSARTHLATGSFSTTAAKASLMQKIISAITPGTAPAATGPQQAPPAGVTWGHPDSLQDHFDRHGRDFQSRNPEHYAAQAWELRQRAKTENLPMKLDDSDGTLRVWEPKTRAFAAYNRNGTTKTLFRPENSTYWQRQPGRTIQASELSQKMPKER